MSDSKSLSTLDGSALVARLALVKERALEDSVAADPYDPVEMSTAKTKAQITAERMDTDAVLDECAARLLDPGPAHLKNQLLREQVERLRALMRAMVQRVSQEHCPACGAQAAHPHHVEGCPWPALVAEVEEP